MQVILTNASDHSNKPRDGEPKISQFFTHKSVVAVVFATYSKNTTENYGSAIGNKAAS